MSEKQLNAALDLMRRLPPSQIEDNLAGLLDLVPDLTDDLLSSVDQPLKVAYDSVAKKDYLLCDYNRDADSYRSPWSNKYDPALSGACYPSAKLREIEVQANEVFEIYLNLYFEGGVSSVYCWDLDDDFAAVVLMKKTQDQSKKGQPMRGTWDSIHVVEVKDKKKNAYYKLTSTVMLSIETDNEATGKINLAGSLTRQDEKEFPLNDVDTHVVNIGKMVEDMESKLRQTLETIYFGKTKEVVNTLRNALGSSEIEKRKNLSNQIGSALGSRN
ncbi:subunit of heterodimeric actin capping protein cap32/34 [Dictyostelium purpureum]|uniref:F-actin-capping protein subunit beta n=1 Tax=Dictyostelium purpureum TaxID=5786 RepID=F0ZA81_DICPU|nr:subunit of heterodimeric actin capping protein cap32/34 [Dictyostelium purpureum]EGC39158.1 subunit of heterodimeric actin capping protein cap32/34 [Dictyostelium purpureum]|eukprot:XP_003284304.1 subunit of heterodimeric actin capping protein cap32/34 [Dictyostelium purpureum]